MSVWSRGMIPASGVSRVQEVPGSNPGTDRFCFLFFLFIFHIMHIFFYSTTKYDRMKNAMS